MDFGIKKSIRKYPNREPNVIEDYPDREYIQFFSIDKHRSTLFKNEREEDEARKQVIEQRLSKFKRAVDQSEKEYEKALYGGVHFSLTKDYSEEESEELNKAIEKRRERLKVLKSQLTYKKRTYRDVVRDVQENQLDWEHELLHDRRLDLGIHSHFQTPRHDRIPLRGGDIIITPTPTPIPIPPPDPLLLEAEQKRDAFLAEQFRKAKKRHAKYNNNNIRRY